MVNGGPLPPYMSNDRPSRQQQRDAALPLKEDGLIDLFSGEKAITPELSTYLTPGHTPGHTSIMVSSAGERAIITGDLAHHTAQVDRAALRPPSTVTPQRRSRPAARCSTS